MRQQNILVVPNRLQLLEAVRRDAEIPVLILSGRIRESDVVEACNREADDYLSKPFGIAELMARVKALLRRATSAASRPQPRAYRHAGLEVDLEARRLTVDGVMVPLWWTRRASPRGPPPIPKH
jgi:two-component system KDP operon response regulator KdpE